jgi:hypothetical protein
LVSVNFGKNVGIEALEKRIEKSAVIHFIAVFFA